MKNHRPSIYKSGCSSANGTRLNPIGYRLYKEYKKICEPVSNIISQGRVMKACPLVSGKHRKFVSSQTARCAQARKDFEKRCVLKPDYGHLEYIYRAERVADLCSGGVLASHSRKATTRRPTTRRPTTRRPTTRRATTRRATTRRGPTRKPLSHWTV